MIKSVGGIIFINGKYLVQLRDNKKNIFFPGFWGVFGGLVEKGEKLPQALIREIKEETNLRVKITRMIISNNFEVLNFKTKRKRVFYECKILGKNKIVLREGKKHKFISYNKLRTLNVVPLDLAAINYHYLWKVKKFNHLP